MTWYDISYTSIVECYVKEYPIWFQQYINSHLTMIEKDLQILLLNITGIDMAKRDV